MAARHEKDGVAVQPVRDDNRRGVGGAQLKHNPAKRGAWPGRVVVRALLKWGGYGLMRFSGQVDGGMSWRGASPHMART